MRIGLMLSVVIWIGHSIKAQTPDVFKNQALKFGQVIVESGELDEVKSFLNDSLHIEELPGAIKYLRDHFTSNTEQIEWDVKRVDGPFLMYTINLYNAKTKEQYGDVIVFFRNGKDLLIDKWQYMDPVNTEIDYDFPEDVPPPPPAPE